MPLENATSIATLNPAYPLGSDPIASMDDHIRTIKTVLKTTFPNLTAPYTGTSADMNTRGVPSGLVAMWSGAAAAIPAGWLLCDGLNSTPDLRDRFIVGATNSYAVGATGGAISAATTAAGAHTHALSSDGSHTHTGLAAGHVLTIDEMPSHKHESWGESMVDAPFGVSGGQTHRGSGKTDDDNYLYYTSPVGGGLAHTHAVTIDAAGVHTHTTAAAVDHSHSVDTRSPYYALCFIMKG